MTVVLREDILGGAKATTLASGLSAGATTLTVPAGGLTTWTPITYNRIPVVINRGQADEEHLYAANVSGNTLTGLTRAQDGTADQAHASGATVEHGLFGRHINVANEFLSSPTAAGQIPVSDAADSWGTPTATPALTPSSLIIPTATTPSQTAEGSAVWDSDDDLFTVGTGAGRKTMADLDSAQTLTSKTLTAPTIGSFVNANHAHTAGAGGGLLAQAQTHQSPDTDTATTALHHTLGAGANQAAAGNHVHTDPVWTAFTPTWAGSGGNPALGNGTLVGRYFQVGKLVVVGYYLEAGSTTTFGSGVYSLTLPVAAAYLGGGLPALFNRSHRFSLQDVSAALYYEMAAVLAASSPGTVLLDPVTGAVGSGRWSATAPFTMAVGDIVTGSFIYEAA